MKDLKSHIAVVQALGAAVRTADATSAAIDLQGFDSAMIVLHMGIQGVTFTDTDKIEAKVTHSDDDSVYTAVEAADIQGEAAIGTGGIVKSYSAAHAAASTACFGYVGGKRYIKTALDYSGTHGTGTPNAVDVIKGHPWNGPVPVQQ